ncbi:RDD family protein [Veronia pacifica]|uniref:RDD domain-containing protein n=1 Tax=Veronia pacifica TaxID=1080227 RepID=A0A1C3EQW3_9GAMM|nr:RDD family protein [Veronia pacifica]ODA35582.1 hypothetical protein A8L45_02855 [Veronia pacifica]
MIPIPNYANYSFDELLDAKNNIDGEEYPERFRALEQEIEARLENKEQNAELIEELDGEKFKNFFRRFFALTLDIILLSFVLWAVGAVMLPDALSSQPDINPPAELTQESFIELQQKIEAATQAQQKLISEHWVIICVHYFANAFIFLFYFILMHYKFGQTLGKMALNVIVVDNETENKLTMAQSIRRSSIDIFTGFYFVTTSVIEIINIDTREPINAIIMESPMFQFNIMISFLLLGLHTAQYIVPLFNKKRRGLHDYIAGTLVVRAD